MSAHLDRIAELQRENERLRAENTRLRMIAAPEPQQWIPGLWFKPKLTVILGLLVGREIVSREAIYFALYQDADDGPEIKIIDIFMVQLRRTLRPLDITIGVRWGEGWFLDEPTRRAIAAGEIRADLEREVAGA